MAVHDDENPDDESFDPTFASSGPRRSTFTPPPGARNLPASEGNEIEHDDDELANALAEDLARLASGPITVINPVTEPSPATAPAPDEQPVAAEPAAPPFAPAMPPAAPAASAPAVPTAEPAPVPAVAPADAPTSANAPQPAASAAEVEPEVPAWLNAPAPAPEQLVEGPRKPTRHSLPDDELMRTLDDASSEPGGTLGVIEHLETQLRLREEEAREFRTWEATMLSLGTPEAIAEVEAARPDFTGVLPDIPQSALAPEHHGEHTQADAPVAEPAWQPFAPPHAPEHSARPDPAPEPFLPPAPAPAADPFPLHVEEPAPQPYLPPVGEPASEPTTWPFGGDSGLAASVPEEQPTADPTAFPHADPFVEEAGFVEPRTFIEPQLGVPTFSPFGEVPIEPAVGEIRDAEIRDSDGAFVLDAEPIADTPVPFLPGAAAPQEPAVPVTPPEPWPVAEPVAEPVAPLSLPEPWPIPAVSPEHVAALEQEELLLRQSLPQEAEVAAEVEGVAEAVAEAEDAAEGEAPGAAEPFAPNGDPFAPPAAPVSDEAFSPFAPPVPVVPPVEPVASFEPLVPEQPNAPTEPAAAFEPPALVEPPPYVVPATAYRAPAVDAPVAPSAADAPVAPPAADAPVAPPAADAPVVPPLDAVMPGVEPASELHGEPMTPAAAERPVVPASAPTPAFSFEELLAGEVLEESVRDHEPFAAAPAETTVVPPLPVMDADALPVTTGSISIIDQAFEEELPDDVDETDRATGIEGLIGPVAAAVPEPVHVPSGPIATIRVPSDEVVLVDNEPKNRSAFSLEQSGLEPTPVDQRAGRAARLFWLWFAANSSILSLALGAVIFSLGMSLRQAIVAALAGVAISFLPLGLSTLAGKRSGLPTMVVSRASFGLVGNVVPAVLALVTRLFWGAALLWLIAFSVSDVLVGGKITGGLSGFQISLIALAASFLVAFLIAAVGYHLMARVQLVLSILSGLLVVGFIVLTADRISFATALTTPDGPWMLAVTGAVLVFSFVGLVWANSGADMARYQRADSSGAGSMLWATFGATLPAFVLIAYGALLAASDAELATGLVEDPIRAIAGLLPLWYPVPLIAGIVLSLVSGIAITLYSSGFAIQAVGLRLNRQWANGLSGVLLLGLGFVLTLGVAGGINDLVRDIATTLAVPTAAWAGIFASELMIRNRRFETDSLLKRGGVYPDVQWINLPALIVITAIGLGFTSATVGWLGWEGYVFSLLGVPLSSDFAMSDIGVFVALVLGLLVPLVAGIPAIRKQESARPQA